MTDHSEPQRPNTEPITALWKTVVARRDKHLTLARQHFSLKREDVERYVRDSQR